MENGRPGHAGTVKGHVDWVPVCSDSAAKHSQDLRLQIVSAIASFLCRASTLVVVAVVDVLFVVPKNLTERFIRLVSEEFPPAVKLAE